MRRVRAGAVGRLSAATARPVGPGRAVPGPRETPPPRPEQYGAVPHIDSGILPICPLFVRRHGIPLCPGRGASSYAVNEESPSLGEAARAGEAGPGHFARRRAAVLIGTAAVKTVLPEIPPETLAEWRHCQLIEGSALLPRELDAPDRFQQAHVTASH